MNSCNRWFGWYSSGIFAPYLGGFYTVCLNIFEFLALAVIVSCVVFLVRRNVLKLSRFWGEEMTSWPRLDANLILIIEILLMIAIFSMNATDQILQQKQAGYTATGSFVFSAQLIPLFDGLSTGSLVFIERSAWWIHIIGILGFAVYVTYSKHLHIFLAFPNTYFYNLETPGKMSNMPAVTHEVNLMLGVPNTESTSEPPSRFGAKDVKDLSRYNILNAYACTECGRCTSECPANLTGKKLSPRKIMMDVRDRAEELGNQKTANEEDGKALLGDYISKEEIFACTSCNACVEACPVNIDPLSISFFNCVDIQLWRNPQVLQNGIICFRTSKLISLRGNLHHRTVSIGVKNCNHGRKRPAKAHQCTYHG